MPRHRNDRRRLSARAARIAGAFGFWLWAKAVRHPLDASAIVVAVVASVMILVNALFLQSGSRSAPYFAASAPALRKAASHPSLHHARASRSSRRVVARVNDPIAQLIKRSARVMDVQRVLSNYGYGQIRQSGILDRPTRAAIERFQHDHKLPATGRISSRLMRVLAEMAGHRPK